MRRHAAVVLYALALVAVVVGVDVLFFRNRFWQRLMVKRRNRLGFRGVLLEIPETPMSAAAAMRPPSFTYPQT